MTEKRKLSFDEFWRGYVATFNADEDDRARALRAWEAALAASGGEPTRVTDEMQSDEPLCPHCLQPWSEGYPKSVLDK